MSETGSECILPPPLPLAVYTWMIKVELSPLCCCLLRDGEVAVEGVLTDHDNPSLLGVDHQLTQLVHYVPAYCSLHTHTHTHEPSMALQVTPSFLTPLDIPSHTHYYYYIMLYTVLILSLCMPLIAAPPTALALHTVPYSHQLLFNISTHLPGGCPAGYPNDEGRLCKRLGLQHRVFNGARGRAEKPHVRLVNFLYTGQGAARQAMH